MVINILLHAAFLFLLWLLPIFFLLLLFYRRLSPRAWELLLMYCPRGTPLKDMYVCMIQKYQQQHTLVFHYCRCRVFAVYAVCCPQYKIV
jgi:hypothetical protein